MWGIPRLYVSACSYSVQLVPLQPIIISILFYHYEELKECIKEVKEIMTDANANHNSSSIIIIEKVNPQETQKGEEVPGTLDGFIFS